MIMHTCNCSIHDGVMLSVCPVCGWWEVRDTITSLRISTSGWSSYRHCASTGDVMMEIDAGDEFAGLVDEMARVLREGE